MTQLEQDDMYSKIKDIHKMISDIWVSLKQGNPNDDVKDFIINVIANQIGGRR
jgi:hypothetical protein